LWSAAVRVRGSRAQRRGRGAAELTFPRAFVLARIRLTRTAAERGPVLSGACWPGERVPNPGCQRAFRVRAPVVSTGSSVSGTLWSAAVRVRGSRAQRRGRSTTQLTSPTKLGTGVNGTYLLPRVTVQNAVLNRFGHVDCRDLLGSFQVSDGAGHATDFVVRACAEAKLFDRFA